jgi:hypothetical protein
VKLLSDFDGVWTYPSEEGVAHGVALDTALEELVGDGERAAVRAWVARARAAVRAEPTRWGWASAGRISAFADEDPFTEHGALLHHLSDRRGEDPLAARLAAAIEARGVTLDAFGGQCHVAGVRAVEARRGPGIVDRAAAAGRELLARGVDIVVVSNSDTGKLARWFAHAGLPSAVHPARADRALRLRGSARKFLLAPGAGERITVGGLAVDVARPDYEKVLREERPDAIVGDVFSLDLALPLALKRAEAAWKHLRLFWLVHAYTTERMRRLIAALPAGEVEPVEGGLAGLAAKVSAG